MVDALEQLTILYNEKLLAGSVEHVAKFEKARAKLDQLRSKASLTPSVAETGKKSKRGLRMPSNNSSKQRRIRHVSSFTGGGGATG